MTKGESKLPAETSARMHERSRRMHERREVMARVECSIGAMFTVPSGNKKERRVSMQAKKADRTDRWPNRTVDFAKKSKNFV